MTAATQRRSRPTKGGTATRVPDQRNPKGVARQSIRYGRQDGYAAPDPDDRADESFLATAAELGYRLTVRCLLCNRWLADPESVRLHLGPTCRQRVAS